MKKITYYLSAVLIAASSLVSSSCVDQITVGDGFLEKAEGEDVNEDLIFSKKVYTEYLLWQCYEGLYAPFKSCYTLNSGVMEALSDIMHSELGWDDLGRMFYTGNLTAANANSGWVQSRFAFISQGGIQNMSNQSKRSIWNCVRDCELLIDNIQRVPDMTDAEKARYTAEAKIILASKYFDGIRHFGGLPIVDHAFKGEDQMEEGRSSLEKTVNFAVNLLDEAIAEPNLPWALPDTDLATWAGRMTKGAAVALKAKLLCFVASPIFNSDTPYCSEAPQDAVNALQVWYGNYDVKRWEAVVEACEQFFEMNAQNGGLFPVGGHIPFKDLHLQRKGLRGLLFGTAESAAQEQAGCEGKHQDGGEKQHGAEQPPLQRPAGRGPVKKYTHTIPPLYWTEQNRSQDSSARTSMDSPCRARWHQEGCIWRNFSHSVFVLSEI